ncbi:MAG: tRNA (adenosine(37)-N6)-threonylcarbamoyltransferase complex ATPase subunit type 1 TsaE [Candidatus Paceibacteria bacterium]
MKVTLDTLDAYASRFVDELPEAAGKQAHVVGLSGELGVGKTTFVQSVAQRLGVKEAVTSPTFVLSRRYDTAHPVFTRLVHVDAYRLHDETKDTFGFKECLADPHTLVLVEWPENLPPEAKFPAGAPMLSFENLDENTRRITRII